MQILNLSNARKAISGLWQSIANNPVSDGCYDPYERVPVNKSEISGMLALHYRNDDPHGYSKVERRDHDNLAALREILYPTSAN